MHTSMKRTYLSATFPGVLVVLLGGAALAQSTDPQVGTWKLNFRRSTYSAGAAFQSGTVTIEAVGAGTKVIVDAQSEGSVTHWEYAGSYEGTDSPITGNCQFGNMAARTRMNTTTVQTIYKQDGRVTATQTSVLSADGKTRTVTTKGVNAAGKRVDLITVYERQ
jgi:hypothetical protein